MSVSAVILADSVAPNGSRITTFEVEHWRAIHAQVVRHRMFSFSAASSRAIPSERMSDYVESNPASPVVWGTAIKGMQVGIEASPGIRDGCAAEWHDAMLDALDRVSNLDDFHIHKSITNRLLEPFAHIRCVITGNADAFANFFAQRLHPAAEPSMQQLAWHMARAYVTSEPKRLEAGEWHLPYITAADGAEAPEHGKLAKVMPEYVLPCVSAARCARVSYKTHDGKTPAFGEDFDLYNRLMRSDPKHASPTEHQARAVDRDDACFPHPFGGNLGLGWHQFRKMHEGEAATSKAFDLAARLAEYGDRQFVTPGVEG